MTECPVVIMLVQDELVAERLSFVGSVETKCRPHTFEEDREAQTVVTWLMTGQDGRKACLTIQKVRQLWRRLRGKVVGRQCLTLNVNCSCWRRKGRTQNVCCLTYLLSKILCVEM